MGLLSGATDAIRRRGSDASTGPPGSPDRGQAPDGKPDDVEVLDKEEGSILAAMIGQREFLFESRRRRGHTKLMGSHVSDPYSTNRNGPIQDHLPDIRPRTPFDVGTYHGFHGPPGIDVQVSSDLGILIFTTLVTRADETLHLFILSLQSWSEPRPQAEVASGDGPDSCWMAHQAERVRCFCSFNMSTLSFLRLIIRFVSLLRVKKP